MSQGPSPHLSWPELGCKDGTPYPAQLRASTALILGVQFEYIRKELGDKPIKVGSAYRTRRHNRAVKGARNSQHIEGTALDLHCPSRIGLFGFLEVVLWIAHEDGIIRGIGVYPWGIHVDVRPTERLFRWNGTRVAPEVTRRLYD